MENENLTVSMVATSAELAVTPAVPESKFVLSIKIPFKSMDDLTAKISANSMFEELSMSTQDKAIVKLQRVFADKPPQGISLK